MNYKQTLAAAIVTLAVTIFTFQIAYADFFTFELYDSHAHLMSPDTDAYPRVAARGPAPGGGGNAPDQAPTGDGTGAPQAAGDARPNASFPGGKYALGKKETPEINALLGWMAETGVEGGAAVQKKGTYGYDNSYILDSADRHGDKMLPVVVLDAEDVNTDDLVACWTEHRNLAGVRFSGAVAEDGTLPWLSSKQALKTWALADRYGLVVDLMAVPPGRSDEFITEVIRLAKIYRNAKIVLDHVAWPNAESAPGYGIDEVYQGMAEQKNIYYKFTTINLHVLLDADIPSEDMLRRVVDVYGADHVMWGSDIGNSSGTYAELVEMMVEATSKLSEAEKRAVMHDTAKAVFVGGGTGAR